MDFRLIFPDEGIYPIGVLLATRPVYMLIERFEEIISVRCDKKINSWVLILDLA